MSTGRLGAGDTAIQPTIFDAKGDLLTATAGDTPARLAVGSNGQYLKADSTAATGLAWATLPSSGKVLQVVNSTTTTSTTVSTTSLTDSTITATITPSSATSKVLVLCTINLQMQRSAAGQEARVALLRGATLIAGWNDAGNTRWSGVSITTSPASTFHQFFTTSSLVWLDSPSTTSATTYKIQGNPVDVSSSGSCTFQYSQAYSTMTLMEIGA